MTEPALREGVSVSVDPTLWGLRHAHDPTVVRDDEGRYVMVSTDACSQGAAPAGVHVRVSDNLVTWKWAGTAFNGIPASARHHTQAQGLWAPDLVRWRGAEGTDSAWRMYWSASSFGSRTSAIGMASAPTPHGPWHDDGVVVATDHEFSSHNAIDACVMWDSNSVPWLAYGSFFSGLYVLELDPVTGHPRYPGAVGERIVARPRVVEGAVEGPFLRAGDPASRGQVTLFVSFDSLFNAYDVRVAQADRALGPFRDRAGNRLLDRRLMDDTATLDPTQVGTRLVVGHHFPGLPTVIAPGHCSVFRDDDGSEFLVHHTRFAEFPGEHEAQIRRLLFVPSGWPVVSPLPYHGEPRTVARGGAGPEESGTWEVLDLSHPARTVPVTIPHGFPDHLRQAPVVDSVTVDVSSLGLGPVLALTEYVTFPVTTPSGDVSVGFAGYREVDGVPVHVSGFRQPRTDA